MTVTFWKTWLTIAIAIVAIIGLLTAAASHPATAGPYLMLYDLFIWPFDGNPAAFDQAARLSNAIAGGVLVGWATMIWFAVFRGLATGQAWIRQALMTALVVWFVVDSTASLMAGVPVNVASNCLFLVAFLLPLSQLQGRPGAAKPEQV